MSAKQIIVKPISKQDADRICRQIHYSGKVDPRSQLHLGVFIDDSCEGVMQFGPSIDKNKMIGLVRGTEWNGFIELNRMAFSDRLPKNSESRALGYAFRLLRKQWPHIKWVVSFSDATQCGDGVIYRSVGFDLTQIKKNSSMWRMPDGNVVCQLSFTIGGSGALRRKYGWEATDTFGKFTKRVGAEKLPGFQIRYIKILDPEWMDRKNYEVLPYSELDRVGARMYKGKCVGSLSKAASFQDADGDSDSTSTLQSDL